MTTPHSMTRREAMKLLGIGAAGTAFSLHSTKAQAYPENETINLGLIGCGGRMRGALVNGLKPIPNIRITAVCDVYDDFLNSAHALVGGQDRSVFKTRHHEDVLERKDVDAVLIATPDHWHAPITIDAMNAGKDVYVEKPMTHKLEEGPALMEAKNRTGRIVQVGAQQRSMPHLVLLKQKLDRGEIDIGRITRVHMQWCRNSGPYQEPKYKITKDQVDWKRFLGNAPDQPFDAFRMRNWRWMWDFGNGPLGDLMVHWLDTVNWLLDLPLPEQVVMSGGKYHRKGSLETPDVTNCIMEFPKRDLQMDFVSSWSNNLHKACVNIMGTDATIYFDRGRYEVRPQRSNREPLAPISEAKIVGAGPKGADFYPEYQGATLHLQDWLTAIREGRDPSDNLEAGIQAAAVSHYGNASFREKRFVYI